MGFIQDYFFEIIVFSVGTIAVLLTAIAIWISAMERKRHRDQMEDTVYEMYLEQKKRQREKLAASSVKISAKQIGDYTVVLEMSGEPEESGDEEEGKSVPGTPSGIPAHRSTNDIEGGSGQSSVSGVIRVEDLANPPVSVGTVKDLKSGKALLLSINMQKVMPRPSGGLLSRTVWIDDVPRLRDPSGCSSALYLLHPGANYHAISISLMAPTQLTNYPVTSGIRASVKYGPGGSQLQDLPLTVDGVTSQQLDVAAMWDTKGLASLLEASNNPHAPASVTLVVHFDGFPAPASLSFDIKVQFASRQRMVPRGDDIYKVPMEFITQAPRWSLDMLNGQPIVLKFNLLKAAV